MRVYNNRKYAIEDNPPPSKNDKLSNILCQQNDGFQLVYLEYYAYLLGFEKQQTKQSLQQALYYQLVQSKLKTDALKSLDTKLLATSTIIVSNNKHLENARTQYYKAYKHDNEDQKAVKLHALLQDALQSNNTKKIDDVKDKLSQQTKANPSNFWIAFDRAWIYFHIEQNIQKAEQQLTQAADHALQEKSLLATIILRYLACAKRILGKSKEALECIKFVIQHSPVEQEHPQSIFESVQFHSLVGTSYKQQIILQKLIRQHPEYYVYAQTDEHLYAHQNIKSLLLRFHIEKLEQIKKFTLKQWQAGHFYQSELPAEFNKNSLFNEHFPSYQALLSHQTYPTLCKTESISKKITSQLTTIANKQLTMAQTRNVKKIIETQRKWKKINQFGGVLLYITVIISFSSILLWASTIVIDHPILTHINWNTILPKLIIAISSSTVIGLLLMRSTPPINRKRFKKAQLLNKALTPHRY